MEQGKLLSPRRTIKAYCKQCGEDKPYIVRDCENKTCILHEYSSGQRKLYSGTEQYSPIKAIRNYCLNCCLGNYKEVKECPSTRCILHPYRLGHRPKL